MLKRWHLQGDSLKRAVNQSVQQMRLLKGSDTVGQWWTEKVANDASRQCENVTVMFVGLSCLLLRKEIWMKWWGKYVYSRIWSNQPCQFECAWTHTPYKHKVFFHCITNTFHRFFFNTIAVKRASKCILKLDTGGPDGTILEYQHLESRGRQISELRASLVYKKSSKLAKAGETLFSEINK